MRKSNMLEPVFAILSVKKKKKNNNKVMKKIMAVFVLCLLTKFSLCQNQVSLGAFSNYSYSLFAKTYHSYSNDFKVYDTLVNIDYFSFFIAKQYENNSEAEYEWMPFYYFKSRLIVKDFPTYPFDEVDYAKNYMSYINARFKYALLSKEKKVNPVLGLSGGISYFQRSFSSYANSYYSKCYPINDISIGFSIGVLAGLNIKISEILQMELSIPYNFTSIKFNHIENKNPQLPVKEMHSGKINVNFMEHSYLIHLGLKVVIK